MIRSALSLLISTLLLQSQLGLASEETVIEALSQPQSASLRQLQDAFRGMQAHERLHSPAFPLYEHAARVVSVGEEEPIFAPASPFETVLARYITNEVAASRQTDPGLSLVAHVEAPEQAHEACLDVYSARVASFDSVDSATIESLTRYQETIRTLLQTGQMQFLVGFEMSLTLECKTCVVHDPQVSEFIVLSGCTTFQVEE